MLGKNLLKHLARKLRFLKIPKINRFIFIKTQEDYRKHKIK